MKKSIAVITISFVLLLSLSIMGEAAPIIVSPDKTTKLGGIDVLSSDMVEYYADTDTAKLIFDGENFHPMYEWNGRENIDAYADNLGVDANGYAHLLISTTNMAQLGNVIFKDGDLVEVAYDYATNRVIGAELFLSEASFSAPEIRDVDIDAVWYLPDTEEIVLSTTNSARLGGVLFRDGDLVKYNPATGMTTLIFSEDMFSNSEADIDAVQCLSNSNILLSTTDMATLGGITFTGGDVVKYNLDTDVATLHFDGSKFDGWGVNVTAIAPIPGAVWLLGSGLLALIGIRRRT